MAKRKSVEVKEEREDVEEEMSEIESEEEEGEESELSGSEEVEEEGEEEKEDEDVEGDVGSREEEEEGEGEGRSSAFGRAFGKIMKKRVPQTEFTELLGPVLADRKQLLVKQFEAEELAKKARISSKEQRREVSGKGHVLPQTYTDAKEKALIKLATKGVVRLFNAVTKAQKVQLETDVSSSKAAKAVWKQSKAAFMTELGAGTKGERGSQADAMPKDDEGKDADGGWAVLRSDFMLGTSNKLKDWDKNLTNSVPT